MLSGIWLDDQGQFDKAVLRSTGGRMQPKETVSDLRRCGASDGSQYREGQYQVGRRIVSKNLLPEPMTLNGHHKRSIGSGERGNGCTTRTQERHMREVCRRYYFTYYCR